MDIKNIIEETIKSFDEEKVIKELEILKASSNSIIIKLNDFIIVDYDIIKSKTLYNIQEKKNVNLNEIKKLINFIDEKLILIFRLVYKE